MPDPEKILNKIRNPSLLRQAFHMLWIAGVLKFTHQCLDVEGRIYVVQNKLRGGCPLWDWL